MSESNTIVEGQDLITLPASSNSVSGSESGELRDVNDGPHQVDSQPNNVEAEDGEVKAEIPELNEVDTRNPQTLLKMEAKVDTTLAGNSSDMEISDEETQTLRVEKKLDVSSMSTKKWCLDVQNGSPIQNHAMDELVNRSSRNFYRSGQSGKLNMVHHCKKMNLQNQEKGHTFLLYVSVQRSHLLCHSGLTTKQGIPMMWSSSHWTVTLCRFTIVGLQWV